MDRIDPHPDHLLLRRFTLGQEVEFQGKSYRVLSRTTLASGEPDKVIARYREVLSLGSPPARLPDGDPGR